MNSTKKASSHNYRRLARNLLWWGGAACLAIVIVEYNALAGLTFAIVAGIGLGIMLFRGTST